MDPMILQQILELLAGSGGEAGASGLSNMQAMQMMPGSEDRPGSMFGKLGGNPFTDKIGAGWRSEGIAPGQWSDPEKIRQAFLNSNQSGDAMIGLWGWDAFNPNAMGLNEAQDRVIRQRGEAMRQAGLNRAKLEGNMDPYMTQYANMRNMFDTGNEISRVQNDMMAQRQQSLEDYYRNMQSMRTQHAMNVDQTRIAGSMQPKPGKGFNVGLPNWMGGGSLGVQW